MQIYNFTVTPGSEKLFFPMDMLRYDCCWPRHGNDAHAIIDSHDRDGRSVAIQLSSFQMPTIARWRSFSWIAKAGV